MTTNTTNTTSATDALADMLPLAFAQLQVIAAATTCEGDEDENGFSPRWELARRYYRAREALAVAIGREPHDVLYAGDTCRWAKARRAEVRDGQ